MDKQLDVAQEAKRVLMFIDDCSQAKQFYDLFCSSRQPTAITGVTHVCMLSSLQPRGDEGYVFSEYIDFCGGILTEDSYKRDASANAVILTRFSRFQLKICCDFIAKARDEELLLKTTAALKCFKPWMLSSLPYSGSVPIVFNSYRSQFYYPTMLRQQKSMSWPLYFSFATQQKIVLCMHSSLARLSTKQQAHGMHDEARHNKAVDEKQKTNGKRLLRTSGTLARLVAVIQAGSANQKSLGGKSISSRFL
ncbi:hypothetical protein CEXT_776921 [Caerostris extrusa]|uniref:Uncharacterized protein n=1 Tax=Caerostris extrusa TaxID=172846 RepID=A0AAV4SMC6_CAEEX|nr:hypothetical protein CEXT_776921 [Caerostris extrusa]